ncbi:MAG TPA: lamin tail domain-containing protein [Phycisphaerales bacterium]|nr:lamin tail domain-containing protein [Phycisphaerales bacterium]
MVLGVVLSVVLFGQPVDESRPIVPAPNPLITEVLVAVPKDSAGDANGDGQRDATGDEFVELMNPHDRAIELGGFTISDRNAGGQGEVKFTFPKFTLEPGEIVVVFNGFNQRFSPEVGTKERAPKAKDERLGCWVFSMGNTNQYAAFSNKGDWVLLTDPDGRLVDIVYWGSFKAERPTGADLVSEQVEGRSRGSACRYLFGGPMVWHHHLDGKDMSPGRHPIRASMSADDGGR